MFYKTNSKLMICVLLILLLTSSLSVVAYAAPKQTEAKLEHSNKMEQAKASNSETPETQKPVQVFDVNAEKVIKTIPNDEAFQKLAKQYLQSVTGLSPRISPDKGCKYVYRIPLVEPFAMTVGEFNIRTSDVFIFHCENTKPVLLCFDEQRKPFILQFDADLAQLLTKLKNA